MWGGPRGLSRLPRAIYVSLHITDHSTLTYTLQEDLRLIMGEPGKPETGQYDQIVEHYRRTCRAHEEALWQSYQPLLEELNRSVPVHQAA